MNCKTMLERTKEALQKLGLQADVEYLTDMDSIHKDLVSIGCPEWRIQMTTVTGRMEKEMVMGLAEYEQLIDKILEFKKDTRMMVDVGENIGYYGCKGTQLLDGMPYLGCYAGVRVAGSPGGRRGQPGAHGIHRGQ